ncbi:MAG: type I asparaginase [Alloprevotella sp.]|nr:type I asparaginase [Alloprevotella sp.]
MKNKPSILILYTGGTIGMVENPETGALENFGLARFRQFLPELRQFDYEIAFRAMDPPIDSSDMEPKHWVEIAEIISTHYDSFDGFVILHGTDTMAYTASALSFMLENLAKPVIITGSQLPIGKLRTDGKENILTSIEIAAARNDDGEAMVPEVCIYFDSRLMRGNRTTKVNAEGFNAFRSFNYPSLAHAGISIKYEPRLVRRPDPAKPFKPHLHIDDRVILLTLFPGIRREYVETVLNMDDLRAVVLKTYGSGNAPQKPWLTPLLQQLNERGVIVVNNTQCYKGAVEMHRYETGLQLLQAGVCNGYDSTIESSVTKLMLLLGEGFEADTIRRLMTTDVAGEISTDAGPGVLAPYN